MSLGATMSAPAFACDTASRASSSSVASLSTSPFANHAAVAVISVFAQTHVGDHDEVGQLALEGAHRLLNGRIVIPRFGPDGVLAIRNPEQQHATNAGGRGGMRVSQHFVHGGLVDARHGLDRGANAGAGADEDGKDELRRLEPRLAHEVAQRGGATEASRTVVGERWHARKLAVGAPHLHSSHGDAHESRGGPANPRG